MATTDLTTFQDVKMDERFKRLERTLKMALLKNAENGNKNGANSESWPSISSIHGDNLDMSYTAMSVQSSRLGSEVVASSSNLRNMMGKKSSFQPRSGLATSSENQFRTKSDMDSVMMPPPRVPAPSHSRRFGSESRGSTPFEMPVSRNSNFAQSTPSSSSSNIQRTRSSNQMQNYSRDVTEQSGENVQPSTTTERTFSRWKVLLNDKAQLIIKGTLECGRVARSKPVIRRLTATTVQSVFKHTYHLQGNLVDERNELPEYVSGKFYNGFPDDWENVYQVWQNFVSDGSRLSFRWPTPITDSDDDINSEVTDITYQRSEKQSRSPRRRARGSKTLSCSLTTNSEQNTSQCSCSHVNSPLKNSAHKSTNTNPNDSVASSSFANKSKLMNDTDVSSFNSNQRIVEPTEFRLNSLKDIIQEDKLNVIIENLTNKNCSLEYIKKIVEMFDCMKYVMSYQSTELSETRSVDISTNGEGNKENEIDYRKHSLPSAVENLSKNQNSALDESSLKLHRDQSGVRKKLTVKDYDSSDSESDENTKKSIDVCSRQKNSKSHRFKDYKGISARNRFKHQHQDSKIIHDLARHGKRKSSLSSDEGTGFPSPRKSRLVENASRGIIDPHDSSISLTEDESAMHFKRDSRMKETRKELCDSRINKIRNEIYDVNKGTTKESYDSSVSITEDERDICIPQKINVKPTVENNQERKNQHNDFSREEDSAYMSDLKRQMSNSSRNTGQNETAKAYTVEKPSPEFKRNLENRFLTPAKMRSLPVKKKPVVVSSEVVNVDLRSYQKTNKHSNENDMNTANVAWNEEISSEMKNTLDKNSTNLSDSEMNEEIPDVKSANKESKVHDNKNVLKETNMETKKSSSVVEMSTDKFGSESNPKKLTGWVPAVICGDDNKCGLVFEGKLLNEAGHIVNRKFTTDFVKRRIKAKLIETIDQVFYQLVGDLNDTKQVVPKDLIKQCRTGCPTKINYFCDKWKSLSEHNEAAPKQALHNTSVDCLTVPTSSRGRRILPPLNYWMGERITTKDNKAIYSPGNSKDFSLTSSLEKTHEETAKRSTSTNHKAKKTDSEKLSTSSREARLRARERQALKKNESSSESDENETKTKNVLRKRKTRPNNPASNVASTSKIRTKHGKNSSQSLERSSSSRHSSFEKTGEEVSKLKLRKRQKTNKDEPTIAGAVKQLTMRGSSGVTCTLYKNVPSHDGDLSEDQLSTI